MMDTAWFGLFIFAFPFAVAGIALFSCLLHGILSRKRQR